MSNNPYQTPTGQLQTDDDQAFGEVSFFDPSGRLNRLRYWAHGMLFALGFYLVIGAGLLLVMSGSSMIGYTVLAVGYIALIISSFIIMIQRLHDLDKSGWMCLLALVPFANIYLIVLLIFFRGTPGKNRFGLQTPPNKTWHWIAAMTLPIISIIGILAAIALPQYQRYVERAQDAKEQSYESEQTPDSDSYNTDESYYTNEENDAQTESETTESEYDDDSESETLLDDTTEESTEENTDENSAQQ
jgi:uncharacterized membrane protein YhaH (DUF805 family)